MKKHMLMLPVVVILGITSAGSCADEGTSEQGIVVKAVSPQSCKKGFVWREAVPGDRVCVTPEAREQAARDNKMRKQHRNPGGGAYGSDTCREGFVWREAAPRDRVCVTPDIRERVRKDNQIHAARAAR